MMPLSLCALVGVSGWSYGQSAERSSTTATAAEPADISAIRAQAETIKNEQYQIASKLMSEYPEEFDTYRVMGFVHSNHGNLDEMAACWEKCRQLQPNRPDIHDQLGRYAMTVERFDEAVASWRRALEIDPKFPGLQQRIGAALLNQGRPDEARVALENQLALTPDDAQSHYLLGEACFQLQDYPAAKASYLQAVQRMPQHSQAYYGLIKVAARLGQADESAEFAKKFQELQILATEYDLDVRRSYDDLRQMRENFVATCIDVGRMYLQHKNASRAEEVWRRAVEVDSDSATAHHLLASLYMQQRRGQESLQEYQQLARLEPRRADHYRQIGFLQARLKNLDAAEKAFAKMVEVAPNDADGYRALAKFYLNTNRESRRAYQLARKAAQLQPIADSYFVLGWSQAKIGQPAEARESLKKALQMDPNNSIYQQLYQAIPPHRPQ